MRILFVAHRLPWPPVKGDKIRSSRWIEALSARHEVYLGAFAESGTEREAGEALRGRVAELAVFRRPPRIAGARAFLTGTSLTEAVYRSRAMGAFVRRIVAEQCPEVAIGFSAATARYLEGLKIPRILDLVDVDSVKWRRYGESRFPRALYRFEARRLARREVAILDGFTRVTVVSRAEAARLPAGHGRLEVLRNGVDSEYFAPPAGPAPDGDGLVFTGAMDYPPNAEGVEWFVRRVLPRIQRERPSAAITIVGSNPAAGVRALARRPGVRVTGAVADVRPALHAAAVAVAPILTAMGVQNKVLEAMAAERPVVATAGAAEGLDVAPGRELLVADGEEAFAEAVVSLLRDTGAARALARAGRRRVLADYAWGPVLMRMEAMAAEAAGSELR